MANALSHPMIGSWNVKGYSTCETKRGEIGSVMSEQKLNMLVLNETKERVNVYLEMCFQECLES